MIESLRCKGHDPAALASLTTEELRVLDAKKRPSTLVVRYGRMKMIGEFPYSGDMTPGCGSKLVVRTHRGTEMGEMLTSTCPNSGCGSSVSRQEMLEYIENSGGRQYPFSTDGKVLRIASKTDMDEQARLEQSSHELKMSARATVESMRLAMKIVEAEPILGGERLTIYYTSDDRIDFRELVGELSTKFGARIDMRQVGARDEARLTADYEKCGQYCCCKNFLKVLKPINMKSAKVQKATLDPVKISGRCGRLMCCLRYEDETYEELSKRLPRRKSTVGTPDGDGIVIQTQILTQLVLVRFDDGRDDQAYPVEELGKPGERRASSGAGREAAPAARGRPERPARPSRPERTDRPERAGRSGRTDGSDAGTAAAGGATGSANADDGSRPAVEPGADGAGEGVTKKRKRRRRRRKSGDGVDAAASAGETQASGDGGSADSGGGSAEAGEGGEGGPTRKKRRRRRRRRGSGDGGDGGDGGSAGDRGGDA